MRRFAALLAMLCAACQSAPAARIAASAQAPSAEAYQEILDANTRQAHIYDWLEDRADVRATYHSAAFKQAFMAARERFHGRAADNIERILRNLPRDKDPIEQLGDVVAPFTESAPTVDETAAAETFLLAIYVADQDHRSLEHDASIWDVTLSVDGGAAVKPIKMERQRRTPSLDQVYPYLSKLDVPYVLYFPAHNAAGEPIISERTKTFTLRVVSKLADAQLSWEVAR